MLRKAALHKGVKSSKERGTAGDVIFGSLQPFLRRFIGGSEASRLKAALLSASNLNFKMPVGGAVGGTASLPSSVGFGI